MPTLVDHVAPPTGKISRFQVNHGNFFVFDKTKRLIYVLKHHTLLFLTETGKNNIFENL